MLNKCGIYKITNIKNNKVYVGSSINIKKRWSIHKQRYNNSLNKEYSKELYEDMRKYGLENFEIKIIEECEENRLVEKEKYYICKYNSIEDGYNGYGLHKHIKTKLKISDIKLIRQRYSNLEDRIDVYNDYSHLITLSGFNKIWNGQTWKSIMPEVFSEDNKKKQKSLGLSRRGEKNGLSKIKDSDVLNIRKRRKDGESVENVYNDYENYITFKSFKNIWYYCNWKHIVV